MRLLLEERFPQQQFYIQKKIGDQCHCLLQHDWETICKIEAEFELEPPSLLWNGEKVDALAIDSSEVRTKWIAGVTQSKREESIKWRP
eukprot:10910074-Karenia_brevis.AAC.1